MSLRGGPFDNGGGAILVVPKDLYKSFRTVTKDLRVLSKSFHTAFLYVKTPFVRKDSVFV